MKKSDTPTACRAVGKPVGRPGPLGIGDVVLIGGVDWASLYTQRARVSTRHKLSIWSRQTCWMNKSRQAHMWLVSPNHKFDAEEKPEQHPMPKGHMCTGLLSEQIETSAYVVDFTQSQI
jgi:hypothetical protein